MAIQALHKLSPPSLPSIIVHRETLTQKLLAALDIPDTECSAPYHLVLLCTPAGYGKTTLLLDAVRRLSRPCCWYTLDSSDADLAVFVERFVASIRQQLPAFGAHLPPAVENGAADCDTDEQVTRQLDAFCTATLDACKQDITSPLLLILRDYHEVNRNNAINRFVDRLLINLAPGNALVIESQAVPDLTLAPLIAHRRMVGLGIQELRFTSRQIYELAHLQGVTNLSVGEAEQLTATFDGWIAGILLGSRLGYAPFYRPLLSGARAGKSAHSSNREQILIYVTQEVFKHEPVIYALLSRTSILARLKPEHCDALLDSHDAAELLAYAEQRGLFVARDRENTNADKSGDYICHPALRHLLVEDLRERAPEDYRMLHSRAARILQAEHHYVQALEHACQAQEYDLAVSIILAGAPFIIYEEHGELILRWLKTLPDHLFKCRPQLLLIASNIHLRKGEFALVPPLLDTADALLKTQPGEHDPRAHEILNAELLLARSHLSLFQGEFQLTRDLCQQALALLSPGESKLRIRAHQYVGVSLIIGAGQVEEGITQLQLALHMSKEQQNEQQTAVLHRLIANAYSWGGRHTLAEYHQARAYQIWERLGNVEGMIYGLTSMGLLKMRQGLTRHAEDLLGRALAQARTVPHFKSGQAYALVGLGDLANHQSCYAEALHYLEDGLSLAQQCEDRYLVCCGLCYLALAYTFLGDVQTAHFFLDQVALKECEKASFEGCLFYLTLGTAYLARQDYSQAETTLALAAETARRSSIQIIHVKALLRSAACYLRQNKRPRALQAGRHANEVNQQGDFAFFFQVEAQRYPGLGEFLKQTPGTAEPGEAPGGAGSRTRQTPAPVAPAFQILALGEPQVLVHGVPVTRWRMARTMELFFFLLETRRPVRKSQISAALWPEYESEQIDSTVRTTIYYLRKALGEESVLFQSGQYTLPLADRERGEIWYDVDIFSELYARGKKAREEKDDEATASAFHSMLDLYHGDYVQSFQNAWCTFRRDQLRQAHIDAHHQLALLAWRQEDWESSLHYWQRLLALDSCHEAAHYGIMRCYLHQGKRELALRQFQACSQHLQEELQATPGVPLQKLYQRIVG